MGIDIKQEVLMKIFNIFQFISIALLLSGCIQSNPKAKIIKVKYVESINAGGVLYQYEGKDNIQIILDFTFDENLTSGLDQTSDDYRKKLFSILAKGAHFYFHDQEVESIYGYWPEEVGSNYAREMSLFYIVPSNHSIQDLRFVYNSHILGNGASDIDEIVNPN